MRIPQRVCSLHLMKTCTNRKTMPRISICYLCRCMASNPSFLWLLLPLLAPFLHPISGVQRGLAPQSADSRKWILPLEGKSRQPQMEGGARSGCHIACNCFSEPACYCCYGGNTSLPDTAGSRPDRSRKIPVPRTLVAPTNHRSPNQEDNHKSCSQQRPRTRWYTQSRSTPDLRSYTSRVGGGLQRIFPLHAIVDGGSPQA